MARRTIKMYKNTLKTKVHNIFQKTLVLGAVFMLIAATAQTLLVPSSVSAAQITTRKVTLSNSAPSGTSSYTFDFTTATTATFQSFSAEICTTASGTCTAPGGLSTTSSTLTSSTLSGTWTVSNATAGSLRGSASGASSTASSSAGQIVFDNVTNPSATNTAFYARITLYSDNAWATAVDTGVVAASTATQIMLSGTMDETLVFCTGISITGTNCGTITGNSVDFGTFSSTSASSGTSVMAASTNSGAGYAITINGSTLTCGSCAGSPSIAALSSQTASSNGTAQFGANLRANTTPSVGTDPTGSGSGSYTANYGTANQYRFVTGDSVATVANATDANTYTVSYIVNVPGSQPAGTYTAIMTYIATATF